MLEELDIKISSQPGFTDGEVVEKKNTSSVSNSESVPIVEKSPAKIVRAQVSIDPKSYQNTVEISSKSSTEAKTSTDAGFSSDRVEPIAIFSQRTVDFQGLPYSTVYASIYQAFMEDQISRVYAKSLFEKILEKDDTFFDQKNEQIQTNVLRAKTSLDLADTILSEIRKFDDIMSLKTGKDSIAQIALQKLEKIGPLTPFTPLTAIVDPVQVATGMWVASTAGSVIDSRSATAVLMMCLGIVEDFLSNGMTSNLSHYNPMGQSLAGDSFKVSNPTYNPWTSKLESPSIKTFAKDLSSLGSVFENGSMVLASSRLAHYGDRNFFYEISNEGPLRRSMIMTTMVANELLTSAGLGRLSQTPLGQRFGSDSLDFPKTYTGVPESASQETSYENSLADFLLVSQEGSARVETTPGSKKVLLLDGMNFEKNDLLTLTTSTSEFAKTTIRTPTKNKMGIFDSALTAGQKSCDDALEFYKMLTSRDTEPEIITPHNFYAQILKVVNSGIQAAAGDITYADKNKIAELAILASIGRSKIKKARWTRPQVARTIMFSACAKIVYKLLQKRDEITIHPGTDALTFRNTAGKKKTKVSIQKEGSQEKDTFTVETQDVSTKDEEAIKIDESVIRMAADEKNIFDVDPHTGSARMLVFGLSSLSKFDNIDGPHENFNINLLSLIEEITENESSMMYQLASLFVDATIEAASLARSENKEANFINSNRVTRASKIDGSSLLCMLFEAVADLCGVMSTVTLMNKPRAPGAPAGEGDNWIHSIFSKAVANEFWPKAAAITGAEEVTIRVKGQFGEASANNFTSKALELLVEGLESGTFMNAFNDEGLIPNLDLASPSVDISAKTSYNITQSFSSFIEHLEELAAERDLPYIAMLSYAAKFDYVRQQTQSLIDLSSKLAGTAESDAVSEAFSSFANTDIGKNYLLSLTDASLSASKKRLKEVITAKNSSAKRNPKITVGELAAIKVFCEELASTPSESVNIFFLGLPTEYMDNTIYPQFKIAEGFFAPLTEATMNAHVTRIDAITGESSSNANFLFSSAPIISTKSFDLFSSNPPSSMDAIVNSVNLENGQTGLAFINGKATPLAARNLVKNEVRSHLIKKIISILSPNDFFVESLADYKKTQRDSGSQILANNLGLAAGLEDGIFSGVFIQGDKSSLLSYEQMLKLTSVVTTKSSSKQVSNMKKLSFGKAEIFYDIFSSSLFTASTIENQVFSPTYFDRVVAVICNNNMFGALDDSSKLEIVSGKPVSSDNQYASDLTKSDVTQGTFGIYNYEVLVTSGQTMVKK
jgi:hypothetical protein